MTDQHHPPLIRFLILLGQASLRFPSPVWHRTAVGSARSGAHDATRAEVAR